MKRHQNSVLCRALGYIKYLLSKIMKRLLLASIKDSKIDKTAKVYSGSNIYCSTIGKYSYIGYDCDIVYAEIGSYCSIAKGCTIGGGDHPSSWVSTSPVFHSGRNGLRKNFFKHDFNPYNRTKIGNDVWIGSGCLIKAGVSIGNGAIIGMGSIVTKDVGDYEIWAGNPAKIIRKRFDNETIDRLLEIAWWDWEEGKIQNEAFLFNDVKRFVEEKTK